MKHLILAVLLLCHGWADAQSNITANRITVKDSLALAGKWIKQINNDSTLQHAGEQSLSTDGALKKYIHRAMATPVTGVSSRMDSVLTVDPVNRQLMMAAAAQGEALTLSRLIDQLFFNRQALKIMFTSGMQDTLKLVVTSSDSITTTVVQPMYEATDYLYIYGKPPFSIKGKIRNKFQDKYLYVSFMPVNNTRLPMAYSWESDLYRDDSVEINMQGVRGDIDIFCSYRELQEPQDVYKFSGGHIINNTRQTTLAWLDNSVIPAGERMVLKKVRDKRDESNALYFTVNNQITFSNGDYGRDGKPVTPIRMQLYKNGQLYLTKIIGPDDDNSSSVPIDSTWDSYDVIIDDTW
jgi:hypothetical protein